MKDIFDIDELKIIKKNMHTFYKVTELNCFLINEHGDILHKEGNASSFCVKFNEFTGKNSPCVGAHLQASKQSEKLGEFYVFFCPGGLVNITMAIVVGNLFRGAILAGPFQMNIPDPYVIDNLMSTYHIPISNRGILQSYFKVVPIIEPNKVTYIGELLEIIVRDIVGDERYEIKKKQAFYKEQRIISENIQEIKEKKEAVYPIELEKSLADKIRRGDSKGAKAVLNELLGYILFKHHGNRNMVISMVIELVVVMSRAAVEGGAKYDEIVAQNTKFYQNAYNSSNIEELCFWMTDIVENFINLVFAFEDKNIHNKNIIKKAYLYINNNFNKNITLNDVAKYVNLSPSYFSRFFYKETGMKFSEYLNKIRIEESKKYLMDLNYSLSDIATMMGFSDQSYFTKVFKKYNNMSPGKYRKIQS